MGKYARLGKNTAFVFIGTAGSKVINLLMLPLYTRWLTAQDYGSVDLVSTYAGLMLGIVSLSIFDSIFIFPKDQPKHIQSEYFSSGIFFWIIGMSLTFVCSLMGKDIATHYNCRGFIYEWLWYIYALLGISYIQTLTQQFLRAIDKMIVYSTTGIVSTLCMIGFSFLLVPRGGVKGYIVAMISSSLVALIYSIVGGRLWQYVNLRAISKIALLDMLKYSIPLIPNGIMWFLISSLNRPLLESYWGLGAVGLFSVAGRFPNLLNTVYLLFQQAWLISVLEEAKKATYSDFYNKMLKIVVAGQCLLAVILALTSKFIIVTFTTPDFYSSWKYIPILVIGVIFMNVATFVGSNFAINRESKYYFYSTVWSGFSSVILNFTLIPFIGIWGAAISMVISQFICALMRIKYSWKTVKITNNRFYVQNIIFLLIGTIFALCDASLYYCITAILILAIYFYYINSKQISCIIILLKEKYAH